MRPCLGSIVSDKVWKVLEQGTDENGPIGHGWTYSAHPIGAAAGVANLQAYRRSEARAECGRSRRLSAKRPCADALADHPHVGDIRGEGMLCCSGIRRGQGPAGGFFDPAKKIGPQVSATLLAQDKVIARAMPQGDILGFAPPFCLTKAEADTVVAATARAVKTVLG